MPPKPIIIYKVRIIDPLQSAALVIVPGEGLAQTVPLAVVRTCVIAHLEDIVFCRHTEGDRETAGQQQAVVAAEGTHVVEAEETILQHDGLGGEARRVVGQQVVKALIDITDKILQDIIVLDTLIEKCL